MALKRSPLTRRTPLTAKSQLQSGDKPLARKTKISPIGKSESSKRKRTELADWRQEIGNRWGCYCIVCGRDGEPAHLLGKGAHPEYRTAPWNALPLCYIHHRGPQGGHNIGNKAGAIGEFWEGVGLELKAAEDGIRPPLTDSEIRFAWWDFWRRLTGEDVSPIGAAD